MAARHCERVALAVLWGASACYDGRREMPFGATVGVAGEEGSASSADGGGDGADDGGPKLDVSGGGSDDAGCVEGDCGPGCRNVDFLFVIDNSVSMQDAQTSLVASFPGFIATIVDTLPEGTNRHVMVVDTDDDGVCTVQNCGTGMTPFNCNDYACNTAFDACDLTIGAGKVHPAGEFSSNQLCELAGGNRYVIEDEPDFATAFDCVARVGTAGNPRERPMDAMVAAVSEPLNGPGGCNEGFLRDDAILVVTFVSDDQHYEDADAPQDWYDALVAAKHGDPSAVTVLGFISGIDGCDDGQAPGETEGQHWAEFVGLWGAQGVLASVCEPDYSPFLEQAVAPINQSCDEFVPPG